MPVAQKRHSDPLSRPRVAPALRVLLSLAFAAAMILGSTGISQAGNDQEGGPKE